MKGLIMKQYEYISKINEQDLKYKLENYISDNVVLNKYLNYVNMLFAKERNEKILSILDLSGKMLFYGKPGVGKTSLAYKIADYANKNYESSIYTISMDKIIESDLGNTTHNMVKAINEIKNNENINRVLILDECDRISVVRENKEEISELKRCLIEFMDFMDNLTYKNRLIIIGTTNFKDVIDKGLIRRFDIVEEITSSLSQIETFISNLNEKLEFNISKEEEKRIIGYLQDRNDSLSCDYILKFYKKIYLENPENAESKIKEMVGGK